MLIFVDHRLRALPTRSISHRKLGTSSVLSIQMDLRIDECRTFVVVVVMANGNHYRPHRYRSLNAIIIGLSRCHASHASDQIESIITILLGDVIAIVSPGEPVPAKLCSLQLQRAAFRGI